MTIRHKWKGKPEKLKGPPHALILHRSIILNLIDWTPWSIGKNLWVKSNIKVAIIISLDSRPLLLNFASWKRKSARLEPQLILELAGSCSEPEHIAQFPRNVEAVVTVSIKVKRIQNGLLIISHVLLGGQKKKTALSYTIPIENLFIIIMNLQKLTLVDIKLVSCIIFYLFWALVYNIFFEYFLKKN